MFALIEIFRILLFFLVFYYYFDKLERNLKQKFTKRIYLDFVIWAMLLTHLVLGLVIVVSVANFFSPERKFKFDPATLCIRPEVIILRTLPLLFSIIFFIIFRKIKLSVLSQENVTNLDEINAIL